MAGLSFLVAVPSVGAVDPPRGTDASTVVALPRPSQKRIVAHAVTFEPDTAIIRPEAFPVLNEAAELLGTAAPIVVHVDQPSDERRPAAYQSLLARRRDKAVRWYLVEQGIALDRFTLPPDAGAPPFHNRPVELRVE
jgi:peptidoglycan-associated lipoprotein